VGGDFRGLFFVLEAVHPKAKKINKKYRKSAFLISTFWRGQINDAGPALSSLPTFFVHM